MPIYDANRSQRIVNWLISVYGVSFAPAIYDWCKENWDSEAEPIWIEDYTPDEKSGIIQDSDKPWYSLPGSLKREYPGQYEDSTWGEIKDAANRGDKDAKKAKKLIQEGERLKEKIKSGGRRR